MSKILSPLFVGAAAILTAGAANAAPVPVDLSSWMQDGAGSWSLAADNNSVFQSDNSPPTVYHNGVNSQGRSLAGTITVEESGGDDDFIGFVLGYTQGDIDGDNGDADYVLVDWKQGTQGGWDEGLAISRVTGPIQASGTDTGADAWDHVGNVELLARGNNFGDAGWEDNTTYDFQIDFTSTFIRVFVNSVLELDIAGNFADGGFGFYNFSQPQVNYNGITEEDVPDIGGEVPVPAALPLMLSGLGAMGFFGRRRKTKGEG